MVFISVAIRTASEGPRFSKIGHQNSNGFFIIIMLKVQNTVFVGFIALPFLLSSQDLPSSSTSKNSTSESSESLLILVI